MKESKKYNRGSSSLMSQRDTFYKLYTSFDHILHLITLTGTLFFVPFAVCSLPGRHVLSGVTRKYIEKKTKIENERRTQREGWKALVDIFTCFSMSFFLFFLLSPFLLSNCCHVFNIRCNLFQTLGWGWAGRRGAHTGTPAILTAEPDRKTGKHDSTQDKV